MSPSTTSLMPPGMVIYCCQQLYLNLALKLCQNIIIWFCQTKKSTVMTSFSAGSKEVILKLFMLMWIHIQDIQEKKWIFTASIKHRQPSVTLQSAGCCPVSKLCAIVTHLSSSFMFT